MCRLLNINLVNIHARFNLSFYRICFSKDITLMLLNDFNEERCYLNVSGFNWLYLLCCSLLSTNSSSVIGPHKWLQRVWGKRLWQNPLGCSLCQRGKYVQIKGTREHFVKPKTRNGTLYGLVDLAAYIHGDCKCTRWDRAKGILSVYPREIGNGLIYFPKSSNNSEFDCIWLTPPFRSGGSTLDYLF